MRNNTICSRIYILILFLASIFCGCGKDVTEYELDEKSFKADTVAEIKHQSGIYIPQSARGLKYHYKPPIDPIIFAKIEIPPEDGFLVEESIAALNHTYDFQDDFANDLCFWWPSKVENVIISKKAFNNGVYIQAYLVKEGDKLILFVKYFTV